MFPFPSNGKAYPKFASGELSPTRRYNRFNSLQTGRRIQRRTTCAVLESLITCFHSLQTGRRIQSILTDNETYAGSIQFQFPSNGKAYPKAPCAAPEAIQINLVSIPFKREGVSKALIFEDAQRLTGVPFQFPSNGKAYPKQKRNYRNRNRNRFNSLQTGRRIQSFVNCQATTLVAAVSIPFKREGVSKGRRFPR